MYIFRKALDGSDRMEFVADAGSLNPYANSDDDPFNDVDNNNDGIVDPEGADYLQWPGQPYDEAADIPETLLAYSGPLTATELYEDSFGQVLTGYAPITDDEGKVVAILATDIKADDFFTVTQQTLLPFLMFIVFLIIIISILALVLIYLWRKRAKELTELDRVKNQFLSIASHDLRAPLTAVRNFLSLLRDGTYGKMPEQSKEGLNQIFDRVTMMAKSVESYLSISRIEQGTMKYEFEETNLVELIQSSVDFFKPLAENNNLTFELEETDRIILINADKTKLQEVINNLIDNSIKYTPSGGIKVKLQKIKDKAVLTIEDTGVGIEQKLLEKIFEIYSTAADSKDINPSSTGVGLYVARTHIDAHGGSISAYSQGKMKGSKFVITLPLFF